MKRLHRRVVEALYITPLQKISPNLCVLIVLVLCLAACNLSTDAPTRTPIPADPQETINAPPGANTPIILTQQAQPSRTPGNNAVLLTPGQFLTPAATIGTPIPPGTILVTKGQEDDRYAVTVGANQILILNYEVEVLRGTVAMTMQGPDGIVWQKLFTASETTSAEIPIQQAGEYEVLISIEQFDGGYSLSWGFRRP